MHQFCWKEKYFLYYFSDSDSCGTGIHDDPSENRWKHSEITVWKFSGGTATTVTFNEDMDIKQIDSEVTPVVEKVTGDKNVQPTKVVGTNQVIIKTRALSQPEREKLNQAMVDNFDVDEALISTESISSTVSSEMRQDAFVAVVVATLCMLAYIWIPF